MAGMLTLFNPQFFRLNPMQNLQLMPAVRHGGAVLLGVIGTKLGKFLVGMGAARLGLQTGGMLGQVVGGVIGMAIARMAVTPWLPDQYQSSADAGVLLEGVVNPVYRFGLSYVPDEGMVGEIKRSIGSYYMVPLGDELPVTTMGRGAAGAPGDMGDDESPNIPALAGGEPGYAPQFDDPTDVYAEAMGMWMPGSAGVQGL